MKLAKNKKHGKGKTIAIAGVGLVIVILTPLLLLFAGVEVPIIGKAYADALGILPETAPDQFEIPINEPPPVGEPEINPEAEVCLEDSVKPECQEETEPEPEIPPITSEDPPIEQLCDEDPDNILCQIIEPIIEPETNTIRLSGLIAKTDSDSVTTIAETSFNIPLQSLFINPETNRDFETGSLDIRVIGNTSATDLSLTGSGELDILIANQTIFTQPIQITFNKALGSGEITTGLQLSTGGEVLNGFTFSFEEHRDKFPVQGTAELQVNLSNVEIIIDSRETFASQELNLLTMTIETDPNLILIINEEGNVERVFPTDVGFAYHNTGNFALKSGGFCGSYWTRHSGTIEIFDSENVRLASGVLKIGNTYTSQCGRNHNVISLTLERDQTYRLVHSGDTQINANFDITFTTPQSQKNYSLQCFYGNSAPLVWHTCTYPSPDGTEVLHAPPPL